VCVCVCVCVGVCVCVCVWGVCVCGGVVCVRAHVRTLRRWTVFFLFCFSEGRYK